MRPFHYPFVLLAVLAGPVAFSQINRALQAVQEYSKKNLPRNYDSTLAHTSLKPGGNLNYLYPLYQLYREEDRFRKAQTDEGYYDALSIAVSFVEDYRSSLIYQTGRYQELDEASSKQIHKVIDNLSGIQQADAVKYISFAAKNRRVVMVNEAVNKPLHRAFMMSLLEAMYKKGFRYLAMEMLNNSSSQSLQALTGATGYFTSEPVAGELVRKALQIGYHLVSYEDTAAYFHTPAQRDSIQAENIFKVIQQDSSAKILVYASYAHIAKKTSNAHVEPMALAFKKKSGIDPLSIDQVSLCDEGEFSYGQALYKAYTEKFSVQAPCVALLGNEAVNITNDDRYDICIIHPPTVYKDGRPTWLSLNGSREPVYIKPAIDHVFLVQAYYEEETRRSGPGQAVPADQSYIPSNQGNYLLYLQKGKYLVTYRDISYRLIGKLNIEVN